MTFTLKLVVAVVVVSVVCSAQDADEQSLKEESTKSEDEKSLKAESDITPVSDHVIYQLNQGYCKEEYEKPTRDCRWKAGLYPFVDWLVKRGRIVAYQIQWSDIQGWSEWFVPGVNDIDSKYNPYAILCSLPLNAKSMRRMWSYFYDHNHRYIICYNH